MFFYDFWFGVGFLLFDIFGVVLLWKLSACMYAPRPDGILESERQEFLATRMWIGMGLANQSYDSSLAMMDPEMMCDYPSVMNDFMALQQVMPPTQAMQERPKEIKVQPRFNPSTRGRRSDPNRNFFGTGAGRGRGTKEGS